MGIHNRRIKNAIHKNADRIFELIKSNIEFNKADIPLPPSMYKSKLGKLYQGNCLNLMHNLENDSIDLIFADPPFNLKKLYPSKIDDNLTGVKNGLLNVSGY